MDYELEVDQLDAQLGSLENSIASAAQVTAAFEGEIHGMQGAISAAQKETAGFSRSLTSGLKTAIGDLVFEGARLSDVLQNVAQSMIQSTFRNSVNPVTEALAGAISGGVTSLVTGLMPFEKGGAFASGRVVPFANGGVVSGPTMFPMRGATGLMGEAGPEAIMPLARGADGSLGVRAGGGGGSVVVNMNISTPDAESFRRSKSQIASGVSRAIQRGQRNM